ncbi:hypothetical protein [Streptomyces sp. ACT015]|uniref:hypothetical protein n=1 Tax=Streptomyces sp. ACT015 TaxID=3134807 RepID=UPI003D180563
MPADDRAAPAAASATEKTSTRPYANAQVVADALDAAGFTVSMPHPASANGRARTLQSGQIVTSGMQTRIALTALTLTIGTAAAGLLSAAPATAGGVGDFLSPAFGTDCANHHTTPRAAGTTTAGTGSADGNLLGLPLGTALNQCGGADAPSIDDITNAMEANNSATSKVTSLVSALQVQSTASSLSKTVDAAT